MSIDVSTSTIIGVTVNLEDFVVIEQLFDKVCKVHGPIETNYCAKCGNAAMATLKHTPTKALKTLAVHVNRDAQQFVENLSLRGIEEFLIHSADKVIGCETSSRHYVMGRTVSRIGGCTEEDNGTESIAMPELMRIYEEVRSLVIECGFNASDIKLYHTAFVGY